MVSTFTWCMPLMPEKVNFYMILQLLSYTKFTVLVKAVVPDSRDKSEISQFSYFFIHFGHMARDSVSFFTTFMLLSCYLIKH